MICEYKTLLLSAEGVIFKPDEGAKFPVLDRDFVDFARKAGEKYEIILLSNEGQERTEEIIAYYGIDNLFSRIICAPAIGCRKPSIELFDKVLEIIGRRPSECIFVDFYAKSLLYAEEVGISALIFNPVCENFDGMTVYSFKELIDVIG